MTTFKIWLKSTCNLEGEGWIDGECHLGDESEAHEFEDWQTVIRCLPHITDFDELRIVRQMSYEELPDDCCAGGDAAETMAKVTPLAVNKGVPYFRSSWTQQMNDWIREQLENLDDGRVDEFDPVGDWIDDHWDAICESWGDKDKWYRVVECLSGFGLDEEFVEVMNKAAECWAKGHQIRDCSSGGPDSGNMDHECVRCGRYWSVPLY